MTLIQGIVGITAGIVSIIAGMLVIGRAVLKRVDRWFEKWTNALVDNSDATRRLTARITRVELFLRKQGWTDSELPSYVRRYRGECRYSQVYCSQS